MAANEIAVALDAPTAVRVVTLVAGQAWAPALEPGEPGSTTVSCPEPNRTEPLAASQGPA
jgi:hypothetical protein